MDESCWADTNRCGKLIRLLRNALVRRRNRKLAQQGITASQADVLMFLLFCSQPAEINQRDIEQHLMLTNPTVTGILTRLEEKGFVQRAVSTKDARYRAIRLTEQSRRLKDEMVQDIESTEQLLVTGMDETERQTFLRLLKLALQNVAE